MLSSPIILYDYPKLAPESAGPMFDGTEIDESLTLRILTLTDEEKLGYFPLSNEMEYYYEAPYTMGASRVGPDLSRIATKMSGEDLEKLLSSPDQEGLVVPAFNKADFYRRLEGGLRFAKLLQISPAAHF